MLFSRIFLNRKSTLKNATVKIIPKLIMVRRIKRKQVSRIFTAVSVGALTSFTIASSATASPLENILNSEAAAVNRCLTTAIENSDNLGSLIASEESAVLPVSRCLDSIFFELPESMKLYMGFRNTAMSHMVTISGALKITPSAIQDALISKDELAGLKISVTPERSSMLSRNIPENFPIETEACYLAEGLEDFSYPLSAASLNKVKVEALSTATNLLIEQETANPSVHNLQATLNILKERTPSTVNDFSELTLSCVREGVSISIVDGKAATTYTQQSSVPNTNRRITTSSSSSNNSFGYSITVGGNRNRESRTSQSLTINGQSISVDIAYRNNQLEASYEWLPLQLNGIVAKME